mgnify:CR=1 FL=1
MIIYDVFAGILPLGTSKSKVWLVPAVPGLSNWIFTHFISFQPSETIWLGLLPTTKVVSFPRLDHTLQVPFEGLAQVPPGTLLFPAQQATLKLVDETSEYALTGAIFSTDRYAAAVATKMLENAAGNFYINDKPTGAVVGQQPFGGARGSGTNDKAGSVWNLLRWVNSRTIKETFVSPKDYRYPFLG